MSDLVQTGTNTANLAGSPTVRDKDGTIRSGPREQVDNEK
jgi:hypothetical protein